MRGVRLKSLQNITLATVGVLSFTLTSAQAADFLAVSWPLAQTANVERISGFYMSIVWFLPALALFLIWIPTTWWVDDDSFALGLEKRALWTSAMVLAGTMGLLVILFVPNIIAGNIGTMNLRERNEMTAVGSPNSTAFLKSTTFCFAAKTVPTLLTSRLTGSA